MEYNGWEKFSLTIDEMARFYEDKNSFIKSHWLKENQYVLICDEEGTIVDKYCYQHNSLRPIKYVTLQSELGGFIKPRNLEQELAMDMLLDKQSKVKVLRGLYGSGKDLLMLGASLQLLEKGDYEKIVYIRPNVSVANVPDIGYLKGDTEEKLAWTLGPIIDKLGGEENLTSLIYQGKFENQPLLFIRGRSFENSIVYVSEGQNITTEIAKLLLGRIGEGSILLINGDNHQTDSRVFDKDNGITKMIDRLSGNKLFAYCYLPQTERSDVARLCECLED